MSISGIISGIIVKYTFNKHKASFMFIESVFYNDTRNDLCRDYSK